ncbi:MAG: carbohydrate ABC transporter permease [Treponema sp.]|nr:carbohydrate ABC transporter permease [Treponema sp.]
MAKKRIRVYKIIIGGICLFCGFICLMPVLYMLATSLSGRVAITSGKVVFWPVDFTFDNYVYVMKDNAFYTAFRVSVVRTVLALAVQICLVIMASYPISLSPRRFHARTFYTWVFLIAVLFSGGLIPTYLTVLRTGLVNTIWALILPGAVPLYYVILMQNFMKSIPDEISESASIDGAGHFRIMTQIVLPLCRVSIATISLFIIVGNWNAWYDGMLYINDKVKWPLQTYLRTVIVKVDASANMDFESFAARLAAEGADTAKIFIALLPILIIYPFAQKHFVKGIVLGSVKG